MDTKALASIKDCVETLEPGFLTLCFRSFANLCLLQLVNSASFIQNAGDLITEHDTDEETEEQGKKDSNDSQNEGRDRLEDSAILVETVETGEANLEQSVEGSVEDINQEENEVLLVVETDTVVNPRAVMVHASNASAASAAVMGSRRFNRIAFLALL